MNKHFYIQSWIEHLRNDKKFIIYASSQAQKATFDILNVKNEKRELDPIDKNRNIWKKRIEELQNTR